MTFSYDNTLDTDMDRVRFEIGDTVDANHLVENEEITYKLSVCSNDVLATSAAICRALAVRFARQADFSVDEQAVKLSQKARAYERMADRLLAESAAGGIQSTVTTKIDGYQPTEEAYIKDAHDRDGSGHIDFDVGRFTP